MRLPVGLERPVQDTTQIQSQCTATSCIGAAEGVSLEVPIIARASERGVDIPWIRRWCHGTVVPVNVHGSMSMVSPS